ncbi:hypothetical protein CC78DRAFT_515764 [Lojkania enalia]|uniref:Dol-P-Man:Man(5)GlcNAc(2)-PP-Dol alpha-1,3-mannosyltransferase n=1 Tax=Lojkania enalia TaxID=147567 RepID=A0A9P4KB48_9PLEO|nr:hypothetical protein CC78DRAFT_515764 [Didymosphaeria enalia]
MSKLSEALKALVNAPFARPGTTPAPRHIASIYRDIAHQAEAKKVERPTWLAMATAATMTMNSPNSLTELHGVASAEKPVAEATKSAELMREVGLKCMGFNGVPRTINCLNAFRAALPPSVANNLTTRSTRTPSDSNIEEAKNRGHALWASIYRPFETKLVEKLAHAHPDLPVHIINSEYGLLFADPPREAAPGQRVGRIATSVAAVACLRAQTGVGPQVTSHLFGLRKALDDGTWKDDVQNEEGARWLSSDDGGVWMLESVDRIVEAIGKGQGSTFAPKRAKI